MNENLEDLFSTDIHCTYNNSPKRSSEEILLDIQEAIELIEKIKIKIKEEEEYINNCRFYSLMFNTIPVISPIIIT